MDKVKYVGLHNKLQQVQAELKVQKTKKNTDVNYAHRNAAEILEKVKPLIKEHDLVLTISHRVEMHASQHAPTPVVVRTAAGKERTEIIGGDRFYIYCKGTLKDIESGEELVIEAVAREPQNKIGLDESQVTGSTQSYAKKYMLEDMFNLDNNKDSDDLDKGDNENNHIEVQGNKQGSSPLTSTQYKTIQGLNEKLAKEDQIDPDNIQSSREGVMVIRAMYEKINKGSK